MMQTDYKHIDDRMQGQEVIQVSGQDAQNPPPPSSQFQQHAQPNIPVRGQTEVTVFNRIIGGFLVLLSCIFCLVLWPFQIRIVREYERGVIFRLGRLHGAKGPGLFFLLPFVDAMMKVDLRTITLDIPAQETITKDSVTIKVNAVLYFHVSDPTAAVCNVENFINATHMLAQTTLRSVLGQSDLDDLLCKREAVNSKLKQIIDAMTEPWGVQVTTVEVKDVVLPISMQRAMASQAEAERERRGKVIAAQGEYQASAQLTEAARVMAAEPGALQLRYLQTLLSISEEKNSTIIFPLPVDLLQPFMKKNE